MARDVVERLRERLEATKGSNYAQDIGGYVCLNTDELEALLAVVEAAKLVSEGEGFSIQDHSQTLHAALARLYAGSSGESD